MSGPQSLQGRCTVCYAEQPKYRCPRCKTETCSLPCYKRHQQRASCNGQRNPASFVKKSQWATPSGIDHDYNYLKTVERNIERAGDDVKALAGDSSKQKNNRQWQSESSLQRYLQQNKITVMRAPTGMSKSRINKTRVTQGGKVFWTVEWIDEDGISSVNEHCPESSKLIDLYRSTLAKRLKASQQLPEVTGGSGYKRRRVEEVNDDKQITYHGLDTTQEVKSGAAQIPGDDSKSTEVESNVHFYLSRPGTSSIKVLVPLLAEQNLTTALRERTIQEYPTIHALPFAADQLPAQYLLEETFLATLRFEASILELETNTSKSTAPKQHSRPPDAAQILEMLRRDLHTI